MKKEKIQNKSVADQFIEDMYMLAESCKERAMTGYMISVTTSDTKGKDKQCDFYLGAYDTPEILEQTKLRIKEVEKSPLPKRDLH